VGFFFIRTVLFVGCFAIVEWRMRAEIVWYDDDDDDV